MKTVILDINLKQDLLDCLNIDYYKALILIAQVYANPDTSAVKLLDIFEEGIELQVSARGRLSQYFVPFLKKGEFEQNVWHLAHMASATAGRSFRNQKEQYFEVIKNERITPNMARLILKSNEPLPAHHPGYAWCFSLLQLKRPICPEERQHQQRRYYTLRKAQKSHPDNDFFDLASVDIFLHGDTAGSLWASSLQQGDFVHSSVIYHEQTEHLSQGKNVLIGDETALPTIAKILEDWANPEPPTVISLTQDEAEQAYLSDDILPENTQIYHLTQNQQADQVLDILAKIPVINGVWGALESRQAKFIRQYLRNIRKLPATHNRIKSYWLANRA